MILPSPASSSLASWYMAAGPLPVSKVARAPKLSYAGVVGFMINSSYPTGQQRAEGSLWA